MTTRADRIEAELATAEKEMAALGPLPRHVDATADRLVHVLSWVAPSVANSSEAISEGRPVLPALAIELLAAFGPFMVMTVFRSHPAPVPASSGESRAVVEHNAVPLPPSGRKRTVKARKLKRKADEARPDNVIQFRRSGPDEVHALLEAGKTQREVAVLFGISERTVRRIVAASRTGQMAALARGQMAAS